MSTLYYGRTDTIESALHMMKVAVATDVTAAVAIDSATCTSPEDTLVQYAIANTTDLPPGTTAAYTAKITESQAIASGGRKKRSRRAVILYVSVTMDQVAPSNQAETGAAGTQEGRPMQMR